jgi:predicted ATPase/signal transduction histidine kinase/tRNA A-37 threonylcarbamoyl transferase component Bud32
MMTFHGYQILTQIYESLNSRVYRGIREQDNQSVILKVLQEDYPTPQELTRYKQEYEIIRNLNLDGVIKAYGLEPYQKSLVIIFEDCGASSLKQLMNGCVGANGCLSLPEFLNLALKIAEILGKIHAANIIHKDINPANIIFNPETGQVKIIDFGIATVLTRENPTLKSPNVLEGTLAYMSPEQTGRMNRSLDYRTDFYSLGVTFYELLTGQLPFETTDALELVHCHIAKQPISPHQINPEIPQAISDIVLKLMAKTAEERYQSAWGLQADLEACLNQLQATGKIELFSLATQDISDKFQIPQKLYGREAEVETLVAAFERVAGREDRGTRGRGDTETEKSQKDATASRCAIEMMLVAGYSGIGKSSLVAEIHKPNTRLRGYFTEGKFDQFQRNIPYSAIVNAFNGLVRQLLTESEAQLNQWREKLRRALGTNAQVIIDVIPEVELIVGKQPSVPELRPTESQNRFNLVFSQFIRAFCTKEHPLVIFLDDLQWADSATLKLIELMMTDADMQYLFLIGAYRDNEVSATHPLMIMLDELRNLGAIVNSITLAPLGLEHITQLMADTLHLGADSSLQTFSLGNQDSSQLAPTVKPLAELVMSKTGGNPFFVNQFLNTLHAENLITFDFERHSWQWDISNIQAVGLTDNVVELMIGKLKKLPPIAQQILRLASCVGASFDLNTLSIICEKPKEAICSDLVTAVQSGLILPTSELDEGLLIQAYKFGHDRIQQAAYALIDEQQKKAVHLQIGRLLLQKASLKALSDEIFEIIDHLNAGVELVTSQEERTEIAKLNLIAGKKAKAATAYGAAMGYLQVGLKLLSQESWQILYDLTLELYEEAAEATYLCGDFEQMEQLAEVVRNHAKTVLDNVKVYEVQVQAYMVQNQMQLALQTALQALLLLGVKFPEKPNQSDFQLALSETTSKLMGKRIEDLIDLPLISDPNQLAIMRLLSSLIAGGYIAAPELLPLISFKQVSLQIEQGNTAQSPFAYAMYGTILCGVILDIESGYQFGQLALNLLARLNAKQIQAKTLLVVHAFITHWRTHTTATLKPLQDSYQAGIETGDLEFAGYSALTHCQYGYFSGQPLSEIEQKMTSYIQALEQFKQGVSANWLTIYLQSVQNLRVTRPDPERLIGQVYDNSETLPLLQQANDRYGLFNLYTNKLILAYLFQDFCQAAENGVLAEKYLDGATGHVGVAILNFYHSLALLMLYPNVVQAKQCDILHKVTASQEKMKLWGHHAPMNYLHKFYLVEAEKARVLGQVVEAMDFYEQAIKAARDNGYIQEEALGYELAAKFYQARGMQEIAQTYMTKAHYGYMRWGAGAKVKHLETNYPQLLNLSSTAPRITSTRVTTTSTTTGSQAASALDLATVMKASQAISGEIVLDKLLTSLMKILIENAGAQLGFLILPSPSESGNTRDNWVIQASGAVDEEQVTTLQSIGIDSVEVSTQMPLLSAAIVHYVIRTKENVVLNDAVHAGQFTQDTYIVAKQPKSILCIPLLDQGQLSGILYLENNLTTDAFTPDRVELLKLLSAQVAISIENAQLYTNLQRFNENLEQLVQQRTAELSQTLSNLKTTQKQLVESEKMAALGGLVAGVAHEINTPIGIGITAASLLAEKATEFFEMYKSGQMKRSQLEKFLDTAMQSSSMVLSNLNRAADLIQSFKQVAVDQCSEEERTFNLKQYLSEILISLRAKLKTTKHRVDVRGDETLTVNTYPGALSQIVTNLVMNSLTHAYSSPEDAGHLVFDFKQEGEQIIFEYSDDGKGIPQEQLSKIFDPFFTTKRGQGGSGLGLHIVYNLVTQKLNGTIECESQVGAGTKFVIQLPLERE